MVQFYEIKKYINYVLETKSLTPAATIPLSKPQLAAIAQQLRGSDRGPAIIIHGMMTRSGTVYVGQLLRLHPDLYAFPNEVWEFPYLQQTGDILKLQREFLLAHEQNMGKIGEADFLPLFGASLIAYLHAFIPDGQRILLKVPSVQYLNYFYTTFPHEHLLVLTRDGRDLTESTIRTWPQILFSFASRRWRRAAQMVVGCHQLYRQRELGYWLAQYEDAVRDPEAFVREACRRFDLDVGRYPFDKIDTIRVRGSSQLKKENSVDWHPVEKPEDFRPTEYWRNWSPYRKWLFKRIAGQSLLDLEYCEDLNW